MSGLSASTLAPLALPALSLSLSPSLAVATLAGQGRDVSSQNFSDGDEGGSRQLDLRLAVRSLTHEDAL